jgi:hypothetical protein
MGTTFRVSFSSRTSNDEKAKEALGVRRFET